MLKFCSFCFGLGWEESGEVCWICHGSGELKSICYECCKSEDELCPNCQEEVADTYKK